MDQLAIALGIILGVCILMPPIAILIVRWANFVFDVLGGD
jgi:hypothetical protein